MNTKGKILKLEALRGFAAAYVVVYHSKLLYPWRPLRYLSCWGPELVMLFFLISGFVIYYSTFGSGRPARFKEYFGRRFRRIYPLFLLALAFSYACSCVVARHWVHVEPRQLLGNLALLQDAGVKPGAWFDAFTGNGPLWSLSYEWWFYMAFLPIAWLGEDRAPHQKTLVAGISLAGLLSYIWLPNQISLFASLFFIWWTGVELAREFVRTGDITWKTQWSSCAILAALGAGWIAYGAHRHLLAPGSYLHLAMRFFIATTLFVTIGFAWRRKDFAGFRWTLGPFIVLAPISYALYIFHYPALQLSAAFAHTPHGEALARIAIIGLLLPFCYVLEVILQPWLNRMLGGKARKRATRVATDEHSKAAPDHQPAMAAASVE